MRILDRYALQTFLLPWLCVTFGFAFLFVIIDLIDRIGDFLDGGAGFLQVIAYYGRFLTSVWEYLAPISLLLGLLFALYQLTRNNEIIAMRASGISIYRVLLPFLILGVGISVLTMWITTGMAPRNLKWTSQFVESMKRPDANIVRDIRFRDPVSERSWDVDTLDLNTLEMTGVNVFLRRPDTRTLQRLVRAESARWLDTHWAFHNVTTQHYSEMGYPQGRPQQDEVLLMLDLTESPEHIMLEAIAEEHMTSNEIRAYLAGRPVSDASTARLQTQLHTRLAYPWLSLVTVMMSVPFSTQTARKGVFTGIMLCLLLFFSLFFTMSLFKALGQGGHIAPWIAGWAPTMIYGILGIVLLRKVR